VRQHGGAAAARDVDDAAAAASDHSREHPVRTQGLAAQVDVERPPPIREDTLHEGPERPEDAGVVDEKVDRTERPLDLGEGLVDRARIGHVGGEGTCLASGACDERHGLG
jgi:hypothetical protein